MAGPATPIDYFRIMPSYNLESRGSGLNLVMKHIINCQPKAHPGQQVGVWGRHNNYDNDREQEFRFSLNKRNGFTDLVMGEGLSGLPKGYYISDIKEVNGIYYALERSDSTGRGRILTLENRKPKECGWSAIPASLSSTDWNRSEYFDISPCNPLNMIEQRGPVNVIQNRFNVKIRNKNGIGYIDFGTNIKKVNVGNYFMIDGLVRGIPTQYKKIVRISGDIAEISGPFTGLEDSGDEKEPYRKSVQGLVFEKLGKGLVFASSEGIQYISTGERIDDYYIIKLASLEDIGGEKIEYITNFQDRVLFGKGDYAFITNGGEDIGSVYNSFELRGSYDDCLVVGQYAILTGDSDVAIVYARGTNNEGATQYRVYENDSHWGTRNKGSFLRYPYGLTNRFVMFDNYGELGSYDIIPYDDGSEVIFRFDRADIGQKFVGTHLDSLKREQPSNVYITESREGISIFLTNFQKGKQGSYTLGTKILKFDRRESFWHVWIVDSLDMYGEFYGFYYGNSIYVNEGTTDDDKEITQILSWNFGDISSYDMKHINRVDLIFGYETNITNEKFFLQHDYIGGDYYSKKDFYFGGRNFKSEYIELLNKYKHSKRMHQHREKDNERFRFDYESGKLLEKQELGSALYGDKLVSNSDKVNRGFNEDIDRYSQYFNDTHRRINYAHYSDYTKCITGKEDPIEYADKECHDVGYTNCFFRDKDNIYKTRKIYQKNYYEHSLDKRKMLSRYGHAVVMVNKIAIESNRMMVASGDQSFQFCGLAIGFTQTDSDLHSRNNEVVQTT